MSSPLLLLSLAFFAGVAVAVGFVSSTIELALLAAVAAVAAIPALRGDRRRLLLATLAAVLFALGLVRVGEEGPDLGNIVGLAAGRTVELTGIVVSDPVLRGPTQELRVASETIALGSERVAVDGDVFLRATPRPAYRYGDRLRGSVTLVPTTSTSGSDFDDYLAERGIAATGSLRSGELLARGQGDPLRSAVAGARADLNTALGRALAEPLAGLAQGITTGKRSSLDPNLTSDFRETGLSHLVVISGGNVTILASLVVAGTAWVLGRRRAVWLALALIAAYTVFVGADAPVVRAAIMASIYLAAQSLGRPSSALPAIAFAAALMVAAQPHTIADLSFQLSFAATAGLALIAAPLRDRLAARLRLDPARRSLGDAAAWTFLETGVVTATAVAATLPLIALHFGRISLVAIPANLLVVPAFPFIFLGSLATAVAGSINATFGEVVGWLLAWLPLTWFVEVAAWMADLPFATARLDNFALAHAIVLYAALLAIGIVLQRSAAGRLAVPTVPRLRGWDLPVVMTAVGALAAVNLVVWTAVAADDPETLDVFALDVGQGDAILSIAPSGGTLLVDGGPDGLRLLTELADSLPPGRRSIDVVVATHPQADHLGGLFALLDRFRVGALIVSPLNAQTELGRQLVAAAAARGVPVHVASPGLLIDLGGGVLIDVLGPLSGSEQTPTSNLNAGSAVLRLRHGDLAFFLTGDIEAAQELALARQEWDLRAAVLKVAHHGSATSTTDLLLRRVRPSIALISVGEGNRFGHPHAGVLDRLSAVIVLRTDQDGTIRLRSDGQSLRYRTDR